MISPIGNNCQEVSDNLFSGVTGLEKYTFSKDKSTYVGNVDYPLNNIILDFEYSSRTAKMLIAASEQIKDDVNDAISRYGSHRIGVIVGSSTAGMDQGESAAKYYMKHHEWPTDYHYSQQKMGSLAYVLSDHFSLSSIAYTISTACTSSAKIFIMAAHLLKANICDAVILGGSDCLCNLTLEGFDSLNLLSDEKSLPFSKNRKGINIGEGAAVILISRKESQVRLVGVGDSVDAYHISSPAPDGRGLKVAIEKSLNNGNITSNDINYINLHGTGSFLNDIAESNAVHHFFASDTQCSSTKSLTGHMLGASGIVEISFLWLTLVEKFNENRLLPPHIWDNAVDNDLQPLRLVAKKEKNICKNINYMMSINLAFGSDNTAVILGG